jgi:hypothetical protein
MSPSEAYSDVVGSMEPLPWPPSYNESITHECPACGARAYDVCLQDSGAPRRIPCVARFKM